jgi:small subunit ribosomal protein S14
MARKALLEREKKRIKLVKKYAQKRADMNAKGDYASLSQLPKNSSPTRLRNRCSVSGRSRGYMRRFGISRIVFRQKALLGEIPGVKKISW